MERSLVLIKPDAMERKLAGIIIGRLEKAGVKLVAMRMLHLDKETAGRHYAVHKDKPFFNDVIAYITSTPIVAAVFEGEDAIETIRETMGATDPAQAEAGTIRADYGIDIQRNCVHGSDSTQTASVEIEIYFGEDQIFDY